MRTSQQGVSAVKRHIGTGFYAAVASIALAAVTAAPAAPTKPKSIPLEASTMIIEYNASAEDIGVQFFLDSEGWKTVEIFDPDGEQIFSADAAGRLADQGGGTELFLESVEPPTAVLPFQEFFDRFPAGTYTFRASDNNGNLQVGSVQFTHNIPAGPVLVTPVPAPHAACAKDVPRPVLIAWNPVTTSNFGEPLDIVRYEVIVENDDLNFDVKFPATTGTMLTVSPELLEPNTDYIFEVLAVEAGGNQTITEGCFTTAK
jgi:hypothetical protein